MVLIMAFGSSESYGDDIIEYKESVDMLLGDLRKTGYEDLTKEELMDVLTSNFSIGSIVRLTIKDKLEYRKFMSR